MKPVRDIVSTDLIETLWEAGYTILPRHRGSDPFEIEQRFIPRDRFYQWFHLVHDRARFRTDDDKEYAGGWAPVPASRHDGYFMPAGHVGNIEVKGLGLFEKPRDEAIADLKSNEDEANKLVDDWAKRHGALLSGQVKVAGNVRNVGDDRSLDTFENAATKTIDTTVGIPGDMANLLFEIYAERDRLEAEVVMKDRTLKPGKVADLFYAAVEDNQRDGTPFQWWPTLRAILLPMAVDNVREKHGMEKTMIRKMRDALEQLQQEKTDE